MEAETIAKKARSSIGKFCFEECKAYCCRKGYLVLTETELKATAGKRLKEMDENGGVKKLDNGRFSLYIGDSRVGCPSLKDNKCVIHTSRNRSMICRNFPITLDGKKIFLSQRCLAVRMGMLFPYIKKLTMMGYTVEDTSVMDFEPDKVVIEGKQQ